MGFASHARTVGLVSWESLCFSSLPGERRAKWLRGGSLAVLDAGRGSGAPSAALAVPGVLAADLLGAGVTLSASDLKLVLWEARSKLGVGGVVVVVFWQTSRGAASWAEGCRGST